MGSTCSAEQNSGTGPGGSVGESMGMKWLYISRKSSFKFHLLNNITSAIASLNDS